MKKNILEELSVPPKRENHDEAQQSHEEGVEDQTAVAAECPFPLPLGTQGAMSTSAATPVGITIAYKRWQDGVFEDDMIPSSSAPSTSAALPPNSNGKRVVAPRQTPLPHTIPHRRHPSWDGGRAIPDDDDPSNSTNTQGIFSAPAPSSLVYRRRHRNAPIGNKKGSMATHPRSKKTKKPIPSLQVFLEGSIVYMACLVIPTLLGYFSRFWLAGTVLPKSEEPMLMSEGTMLQDNLSPVDASSWTSTNSYQPYYDAAYQSVLDYACSTSPTVGPYIDQWGQYMFPETWTNTVPSSYSSWTRLVLPSSLMSTSTSSSTYWTLAGTTWCPTPVQAPPPPRPVVSPDTAGWNQDAWLIVIFSVALACLRICLIQVLVLQPLSNKKSSSSALKSSSLFTFSIPKFKNNSNTTSDSCRLQDHGQEEAEDRAAGERYSESDEDETEVGPEERLEALIRCRSIHLLSADYRLTPAGTPVIERNSRPWNWEAEQARRDQEQQEGEVDEHNLPPMPNLEGSLHFIGRRVYQMTMETDEDHDDHPHHVGLHLDEEEDTVPLVHRAEIDEDCVDHQDAFDDMKPRRLWTQDGVAIMTDTRTGAIQGEPDAVQDDRGSLEEIGEARLDPPAEIWEKLQERLEKIHRSQQEQLEGQEETKNRGLETPPSSLHGPPPIIYSTTRRRSSSISRSRRLNAGPRYATALFRFLYSVAASGLALYYFREANFWPWYVFGKGSTVNCWDLSGGLSVGMDSDFDHHNSVLKRYFLWQASYHWHSGAFHIMSMMMLFWWQPASGGPERRRWWPSFTKSGFAKSLGQHVMALVLIGTAYIFSSLRRLFAIGMFAFDVSNSLLHLLQICINAPEQSVWKWSAGTVVRFHRTVVLLSFVWTRLVVWPCLWRSATGPESADWLRQLEAILWPGAARLFRWVLHGWMLLATAMTAVYMYRLLHHPHLQRIVRTHRHEMNQQPPPPPLSPRAD